MAGGSASSPWSTSSPGSALTGTATDTTINNGGVQYVGLKTTSDNGLYFSGAAISTTIQSGGEQIVGDGGIGTATDTTINNGGKQIVGVGDYGSGTATNTTINGVEYVQSGIMVDVYLGPGVYRSHLSVSTNNVTFGPSGSLYLGWPQGLSGTISDWQTGDMIDFVSTSVVSAGVSGTTLSITVSGGQSFDYNLADQEANTVPSLQNDGAGGTEMLLVLAPPTVVSVMASPSTGDLDAGKTVMITLAMTEAVTVSGTPTLTLNDGGSASFDAANSTPTSLVFDYSVSAGQDTSALAVTGSVLNGATIENSAGGEADLSGAVATFSGLQIDTTAPTIAITSPIAGDNVVNAAEARAGFTISGTATDNDANGQTATIAILDSTSQVVDSYQAMVSSGGWSVNVSAAQAQVLADGAYTVTADVKDAAGNLAAEATQAITVDTDASVTPDLVIANGHPVVGIDGIDAVRFTVSGLDDEQGSVTFGSGSNTVSASIVGDNSYSVDLSALGASQITSSLSATDPAGNSFTATGNPITIDPGPTAGAASITFAPGQSSDLTSYLLGLDTPGIQGDTLTLTGVDTAGTLGTVAFDSTTGDLAYTAPSSAGTDSFTYTVADQYGDPASATVSISVASSDKSASGTIVLGDSSTSASFGNNTLNVIGGGGSDTISAGGGNDSVNLGNGDDSVTLKNGNDAVNLGTGSNDVSVGGGNDTIAIAGSPDASETISAGGGNDLLYLGAGTYDVKIGNGTDTFYLGGGTYNIDAGNGVPDEFIFTDPAGELNLKFGSNDELIFSNSAFDLAIIYLPTRCYW